MRVYPYSVLRSEMRTCAVVARREQGRYAIELNQPAMYLACKQIIVVLGTQRECQRHFFLSNPLAQILVNRKIDCSFACAMSVLIVPCQFMKCIAFFFSTTIVAMFYSTNSSMFCYLLFISMYSSATKRTRYKTVQLKHWLVVFRFGHINNMDFSPKMRQFR